MNVPAPLRFPGAVLVVFLAACGPETALPDGAPPSGDATSNAEQALTGRLGVDYSSARPSPASLRAAGYTFVVRYLSDYAQKNISIGEANALEAAGIDVVANWEDDGHQEILDGWGGGVHAAQVAAEQAAAAGMPGNRPIYFSVDFDAQPYQQAAVDAFFDGAASVIGRARVGAYGSYGVISRLFDAGKINWGWQTYAWSYGQWDPRASMRQIQNSAACGGGCDIDQALAADFGQWRGSGGGGAVVPESPLGKQYVALMHAPGKTGYWLVAADGGVFTFGEGLAFHGSMGGKPLAAPIIGGVAAPDGNGYWLIAADGGVFAFGSAQFHGSMGGQKLNAPVVGMAATPDGGGYWLVAADGGIFAFGNAGFFGSMGGQKLNAPVVGMASSVDGKGYWLVASDGGIFAFGDAPFHGSMGGTHLNAPVVGIAATADGKGYWLVAKDGGIFAFGDAAFHGSMGGTHLNAPVVGIADTADGYWMLGHDGGVFAFGAAGFYGSRAGM
jgi:hypothetical protein